MSEYKYTRKIVDPSGVYINVEDLIHNIKAHKERVKCYDVSVLGVYGLAHDHIIDLIKTVSEV